MQVGDLNLVQAIIDSEIRIGLLERVIEHMGNNSGSMPSQSKVNDFRKQAQGDVQKKYPALGIQFN